MWALASLVASLTQTTLQNSSLNLKYFYILKTQIYPFVGEACPCQEFVLGQERLLVGKGPAMYAGEAQFPLPTSS